MIRTPYGIRNVGTPVIAARRCMRCGRSIPPDSTCHYCRNVQEFFDEAERIVPGSDRAMCNLVAHLAAGLEEGYSAQRRQTRFVPSLQDLHRAVDISARVFKTRKYVLPKASEQR